MTSEIKQQIDHVINSNSVVLFMKGNKERPQCGFSKQVVDILSQLIHDFVTVDVLEDPMLREGIKVYSSWPTIPQLYIDGEFIGGCDIVRELYSKNELQDLLKIKKAKSAPKIDITNEAMAAFNKANADRQDDECIRLTIAPDFEHNLSFDKKQTFDFLLQFSDLNLIIDPYSALRAENLSIDYVTDKLDSGFSFNNPNEPPLVLELSVDELKAWRDQGKDALLIDVRTKAEWEKANISFAKLFSEMSKEEVLALKKNQPIVFHCHHGGRSRKAAESFRARGFTNVYNLSGGIDAWSRRIDSSVPVYTK